MFPLTLCCSSFAGFLATPVLVEFGTKHEISVRHCQRTRCDTDSSAKHACAIRPPKTVALTNSDAVERCSGKGICRKNGVGRRLCDAIESLCHLIKVTTFKSHQVLFVSILDHLTVFEDVGEVHVVDDGNVVGNDDGRFTLADHSNCVVYEGPGDVVQGTGSFVKDEDFWVSKDSACEC